jgi:hypothetical protein
VNCPQCGELGKVVGQPISILWCETHHFFAVKGFQGHQPFIDLLNKQFEVGEQDFEDEEPDYAPCAACGHPFDIEKCGFSTFNGIYYCHADDHTCYDTRDPFKGGAWE